MFKLFWKKDEGQDLIEYALLAALISIVSILILTAVGLNIQRVFTTINGILSGV